MLRDNVHRVDRVYLSIPEAPAHAAPTQPCCALMTASDAVTHAIKPGRNGWVQVARGSVRLNGEALQAGDGAAVSAAGALKLEGDDDAELLLFDMAL